MGLKNLCYDMFEAGTFAYSYQIKSTFLWAHSLGFYFHCPGKKKGHIMVYHIIFLS